MRSNIHSLFSMRLFDELAMKKTIIHNIHPFIKLLVTLFYLLAVISLPYQAVPAILPFFLYPFILIPLAELPIKPLLTRLLPVMPFVTGIGIFNPFFDTRPGWEIAGLVISSGWISFFMILLKTILTVMATLLLFATTGITRIAAALRILHVPQFFVLQLLLTYRYLSLINEERYRLTNAYTLRAPGEQGVSIKAWGSLAGQMLLRTLERAQRIFHAMTLRGFDGSYQTAGAGKIRMTDIFYVLFCTIFFVWLRFSHITNIIGSFFITGGNH